MRERRSRGRKFVEVGWVSVLVVACASGPQRAGRGQLRLDSETAARVTHAAAVSEGTSTAGTAAARVVASRLAEWVPMLLAVLKNDNAVGELEEQLKECVRLAERQVNARYFGKRAPTREECSEQVEVDGCGRPITRAMLLGQQKHGVALQCAQEVLEHLWPAPFSIVKFPCPPTNDPQWTRYGESSAYAGSNQGKIYEDALGGRAVILSPRTGMIR